MKSICILIISCLLTQHINAQDSNLYKVDKHLEVNFPCYNSQYDTAVVSKELNLELNLSTYHCKTNGGTFWVIRTHLNDSISNNANDFMEGVISGTLNGNKGKLLVKNDTLIRSVRTKYYELSFKLREIPYRSENLVFIYKDESYILGVWYQTSKENMTLQNLRKNFLYSYTLK